MYIHTVDLCTAHMRFLKHQKTRRSLFRDDLVKHEVAVRLRVHHEVLLHRAGSGRALVSLLGQQLHDDDVQDEEGRRDDDQPEGVSDAGLAGGGPAAVGDVVTLKHVAPKFDVELDDPGDDGSEARQRGQRVPQHQA